MNILITGGTGFIGKPLIKLLSNKHKITVLTRNPKRAASLLGLDINFIQSLDNLRELNQFDAVINLAGEPIANKRWCEKQKQTITQSRWNTTLKLVQLMHASSHPPDVFLSGSAIGIYGRQGDQFIDENFENFNDEFTHKICSRWEQLAKGAPENVRLCMLRTGIVLGKNEGALKRMLPAFKLGLGGPIASGEQYMSWIHINDMVKAILFLLSEPSANGIFNLTAPNPVTNQEFTEALASTLHRPASFRMPAPLLKVLFGEMADLLIYGQRVIPKRLQQHGFHFCHNHIDEALNSLLKN